MSRLSEIYFTNEGLHLRTVGRKVTDMSTAQRENLQNEKCRYCELDGRPSSLEIKSRPFEGGHLYYGLCETCYWEWSEAKLLEARAEDCGYEDYEGES